jgi:thymidylate kinase
MDPIRISVIGIDGSGKSSTAMRSIFSLSEHFSICKPGRMAFSMYQGNPKMFLPEISIFFESLFKKVDQTRKRNLIGFSRIIFVLYQNWLEPFMIRRFSPKIVLSTRCMIIDSAIYAGFYYLTVQRVPLDRRLKLISRWIKLPFRDLYFLLQTPINEAIERIHRRISQEHGSCLVNREYWLHIHEYEPILNKFAQNFRQGLADAQRLKSFHVVEIDTSKYDEVEVSGLISDLTNKFLQNPFQDKWMRI